MDAKENSQISNEDLKERGRKKSRQKKRRMDDKEDSDLEDQYLAPRKGKSRKKKSKSKKKKKRKRQKGNKRGLENTTSIAVQSKMGKDDFDSYVNDGEDHPNSDLLYSEKQIEYADPDSQDYIYEQDDMIKEADPDEYYDEYQNQPKLNNAFRHNSPTENGMFERNDTYTVKKGIKQPPMDLLSKARTINK